MKSYVLTYEVGTDPDELEKQIKGVFATRDEAEEYLKAHPPTVSHITAATYK